MKISAKILFILLLFSYQIQAQYYVSKDFERKGVTEYLFTYWGSVATYWTNINKKETPLKIYNSNMDNPQKGYTLEVSFPGNTSRYHFLYTPEKLICTHPNGQKQVFKALPELYISKNFEKAGITEYLQKTPDGQSYFYFTSKNKRHKIRLLNVKTPDKYDHISFKFPGGKTIYKLAPEGICLGGIICFHHDGREQRFALYNWKD